ncbi:MAG: NAD(P)H-hydrate epimerase [Dehalococcoidia bacterium]
MKAKPDPGGFPVRKMSEVPTVAPDQMREIQRIAQEDFGMDLLQITENAGRAAATVALAMLGGRGQRQRVVVLAGGGNKGAAGLCAVRHLVNWGLVVEPIFGEVESEMSFIARKQIQILRQAGIVEPGDEATSEITLEEHLEHADLVIDALVGYGLSGPPTGIAAAITELALAAKRPILALDVPTGVSALTGEASEPAIRAVTTVILDLPKKGVCDSSCRQYAGELYLADLGIPRSVHERMGIHVAAVFSEGPIVHLRR